MEEINDELINKRLATLGDEIIKFTPQIIRIYDSQQPVKHYPHASSVLLTFQNEYYLLTAGHVIYESKKLIDTGKLGITIDDNVIILLGNWFHGNPNKNKVSNDVDIAILKLDKNVVESLKKKHSFFDHNTVTKNPASRILYHILGYPVSKTKLENNKSGYIIIPFYFSTIESDEQIYQKLKRDKKINIILNYDRKKVKQVGEQKTQQGPQVAGISGCGLWQVQEDNLKPILAGIMNEESPKEKALVATRINHYLDAIRKHVNS